MAFQGFKKTQDKPSARNSGPSGPQRAASQFDDPAALDEGRAEEEGLPSHEFEPVYLPERANSAPLETLDHGTAQLIEIVAVKLGFSKEEIEETKAAAAKSPAEHRKYFKEIYDREIRPGMDPPALRMAMENPALWSFEYRKDGSSVVVSVPRDHGAFSLYHGCVLEWAPADMTPFPPFKAGAEPAITQEHAK